MILPTNASPTPARIQNSPTGFTLIELLTVITDKKAAMRSLIAGVLTAGLFTAGSIRAAEVKPLGEMDGFYRYTAVLGPLLEKGQRLRKIPDWMFATDFPYQKRPYAIEIPFADGLSVVRLLGGWEDKKLPADRRNDPNDLVYRDDAGALHYRWNLLKARLDPFISNGYTQLTLVMDNVPYCLAEKPIKGNFGQVAPPGNLNEWYTFVRDMCRELNRLYGEDVVKNFRFRMGTEMQDQRRFAGSQEQYFQYYDFAAKAVKEEIPSAGFGPFNRAMPYSEEKKGELPYAAIDIIELVKHCATGTNTATGQIGSPINFVARSFYYFSAEPKPGTFNNIHPDQRTPEQGDLWRQARAVAPSMAHLSREVQEFGPHLETEQKLYGLDTGARGAAQTLHTLANFKEEGADRIWHWELFENVTDDKALMMSQGWLYSVLDHMRGGQLYTIPVNASPSNDNTQKALLSVQENRAILIVANWNVDREKHAANDLTLFIPNTVLTDHKFSIRQISFTEETSVYDVIRRDYKAAGLLSKKHLEHRGAPATLAFASKYDIMAENRQAGQEFIKTNWNKYEQLMRDALKLRNFSGTSEKSADGITITFKAENPSVTVLVMDFDK